MLSDMDRAEQKLATRATVLEAARTVLAREGLAGTTTRKVAEEAGVAVGTVFVHFPDVAHLVEALLDEHLAKAVAKATRAAKGDLVTALTQVAKGLFDSYDREPELAKAFLTASLFGGQPGGLQDTRLAAFEQWVGARLAAAIAAGEVPPVDLEVAFAAYFSLYFGALVAGLRGLMTRRQQQHFLERALRRFFSGKEQP
jgi:AcrR family transcriptional regulator